MKSLPPLALAVIAFFAPFLPVLFAGVICGLVGDRIFVRTYNDIVVVVEKDYGFFFDDTVYTFQFELDHQEFEITGPDSITAWDRVTEIIDCTPAPDTLWSEGREDERYYRANPCNPCTGNN